MDWHPFESGATLGTTGSEDGVIVRDDEHPEGARITLEEGGRAAPFAITCGVYGWMAHTRLFSTRREADAAYEAMRSGLAAIAGAVPHEHDPGSGAKRDRVIATLADFVERYP